MDLPLANPRLARGSCQPVARHRHRHPGGSAFGSAEVASATGQPRRGGGLPGSAGRRGGVGDGAGVRWIALAPKFRDLELQASGFPGAGRAVEGEHLHPGGQFAGHRHQLALELVLVEAVQREPAQPGVLGAPDPVLTACLAAVTQLQVSELPGAGVGGEADDAVPVDVGGGSLLGWRAAAAAPARLYGLRTPNLRHHWLWRFGRPSR